MTKTFNKLAGENSREADTIEGYNLLLAMTIALSVMLVAIFFAVKLSAYSGYMWPGFLPLFIGWAGLYPIFKRLESPKQSRRPAPIL